MGSLLKDLKEGDIVVISRSSSYYDRSDSNPTDDIKGAVTKVHEYSATVKWNNGKSNGYRDHDLVKVSETAPIPSELTKTPIVGKWYTSPSWSKGSLGKFRAIIRDNEFGYSERMYPGDSSTRKLESSWTLYKGVRLATESELRTLPKSHPDHPDKSSSSDKRGTPIGSYTPKKGDKVKVVANRGGSGVSIGDIGIVDHLNSDHCSIKVDSRTYYNYFDDLELISTEKITSTLRGVPIGEYTPKTGDKVRIVANRSGSSNKIGDIGIVVNDYSTNCVVDVDGRSRGGNSHYYDDLEFISSKATTYSSFNFKEGDRVKIIANTNNHDFSIGATGYLKGTKGAATRGGYYWLVDGVAKRVTCNAVRECDMELFTDSYEAPKLPSVDFLAYSLKETYLPEDVVSVRIVKIPRDEIKGWSSSTVDKVCKIPLGTIMTVRGESINDGCNLIPNNNYYSFNFPRDWFQVLGIHERDMPSTTRSSAVLDPITGHAKVWRIKTQREMIEDDTIPSGGTRPLTWNSQMDKHFGEIIPSKFYPDIERMGDRSIDLWEGYCYNKSHLTTKSMPWDTSVVKHFVDSDDDEESEYDDEDDDEQEEESSGWEYKVSEGAYDSDLDKLDEMSKGAVWFEKSEVSLWDEYRPPTKRPKLEVEVIPHKSRKIF